MKYLSNYFLLNINQRIKKMANKILWKLHQIGLFFFFFLTIELTSKSAKEICINWKTIPIPFRRQFPSQMNCLIKISAAEGKKKQDFHQEKKEYFWGFKKIPDSKYQRHDVKFKYGYVSREERTFATSNVPRW